MIFFSAMRLLSRIIFVDSNLKLPINQGNTAKTASTYHSIPSPVLSNEIKTVILGSPIVISKYLISVFTVVLYRVFLT